MKLPHFLLLCACTSAAGFAFAQSPGRALRDADDMQEMPRREFQQDLSRDRPDRRERLDRAELREPREPMSMEERRQLRRDVNDAGREIYRRPDRY